MRLHAAALALAALTYASAAHADDWSCKNNDFQISCTEESCEAADSHTPMSVSVNDHKMQICAYSGCWSGPTTTVTSTGPFETYVGEQLVWSTNEEGSKNIAVTIDAAGGVGTMIITDYFAHPLNCESN